MKGSPRKWLPYTLTLLILMALFSAACASAENSISQVADAPMRVEMTAEEAANGSMTESSRLANTRKIIANADISLVVAETEAAVAQIEMMVAALGGYVAKADLSKSRYGEREVLEGSLMLRVPAESLADALDRLQTLATDVRNLNVNRQDVTAQYSDLEAQLHNLRATEKELLALLAEVRQKPTATAEDILAVYRSLTEIRGEIEILQGRKNLLDNQIGFSTIQVDLIPDAINRPIVEERWNVTGPVRNALRALVNSLQGLATALIWVLLYLTPLLLLFLIPLVVVAWLVRLWLRRRLHMQKIQ